MRYHEILPSTHPHIVQIVIDPAQFAEFRRLTEDVSEVRLLRHSDSTSDRWTLSIACASPKAARQLCRLLGVDQ